MTPPSHFPPDLEPPGIEQRIAPLSIVRRFRYFDAIESSSAFLCGLPPDEACAGTLVVTDHQTAGRGRYRRRWWDAPGRSLLFSLLLEAPRPARNRALLALGAAVAVCRSLEREGLAQARIRWPNDVLIGDRKVAGILAEPPARPNAVVLGVGLNVHHEIEHFPPDLRDTAGSLQSARPRDWRRDDLLVAILTALDGIYEQWRGGEDAAILEACRRRMSTLGRPVYLHSHGKRVEGVVMGLESDGSLVVREGTGIVSRWHSGEVEELRWAD